MMLSWRMPRARPGARASSKRNPSPSGPRWDMAAVMAPARDWAWWVRAAKGTPQMPHTLLFDLRRGEKGGAGTLDVAAETETGEAQTMIGVPGEQKAKNEEE